MRPQAITTSMVSDGAHLTTRTQNYNYKLKTKLHFSLQFWFEVLTFELLLQLLNVARQDLWFYVVLFCRAGEFGPVAYNFSAAFCSAVTSHGPNVIACRNGGVVNKYFCVFRDIFYSHDKKLAVLFDHACVRCARMVLVHTNLSFWALIEVFRKPEAVVQKRATVGK